MRVFEDHKEPIPIPVDNNDDDDDNDEDDERSRKIRRVLKKKKPPSITQQARKNQASQADPIDHHHHAHRMSTPSRRNEKALDGRSNGSIRRVVSGSKTTRNAGSTMASSHSAVGYSCRSRGIYDVESLDLFRSYGCFLVYQIVVLLFIIFFLYTCL
ncbi:hypothetical protein PGT21_031311 [Puccinia graminis f. sp. tritici]|uniref:Uncharacterized protein n=1 Tax=Puccinia graminis f. sp. tritici TaxID=56615 RepID=A0A5B0NRT9_PUCGR|nr:hypothetical protein PGTUg99_031906 [Puccinia graminis f. sp. tritici]KAA1091326.1 hypothetical protein PGT21_031311 [Puccinia graminis f. sp. tritici]